MPIVRQKEVNAKAESNAVRKPGQPHHLEATQQGPGTVALDWKAPLFFGSDGSKFESKKNGDKGK